MRLTNRLQRIVGVGGLVLEVRLRSHRIPRCGNSEDNALDTIAPLLVAGGTSGLADLKIWLRYAPRRVQCRRCGIRTEQVSWAGQGGRFTYDFEEIASAKATAILPWCWITTGGTSFGHAQERAQRHFRASLKHLVALKTVTMDIPGGYRKALRGWIGCT